MKKKDQKSVRIKNYFSPSVTGPGKRYFFKQVNHNNSPVEMTVSREKGGLTGEWALWLDTQFDGTKNKEDKIMLALSDEVAVALRDQLIAIYPTKG